jgi:hypothetical protein
LLALGEVRGQSYGHHSEIGPARHFVRIGITTSAAVHAIIIVWALVHWDLSHPFKFVPAPAVEVDLVSSKDLPKLPPDDPQKPAEETKERQDPKPDSGATAQKPAATASDTELAETAARLAELAQLPMALSQKEGGPPASQDAAKLGGDTIAAFKAHFSKCWASTPGRVDAQNLNVTIRIGLKQNGELAGEPTLLEATLSPAGPVLVKKAMQALRKCQPYAFLPADRYKEWKVLDLRFSPQGLSGV